MAGKKESSAKIDDRKSSSVPEKFKPIPYVEMTNRSCNLESLARVQDERFCNKYYVCSADRYVSLFCPTGMAFDYSQQNCRLQTVVDCSQRQLIGNSTRTSLQVDMRSIYAFTCCEPQMLSTELSIKSPDIFRSSRIFFFFFFLSSFLLDLKIVFLG